MDDPMVAYVVDSAYIEPTPSATTDAALAAAAAVHR